MKCARRLLVWMGVRGVGRLERVGRGCGASRVGSVTFFHFICLFIYLSIIVSGLEKERAPALVSFVWTYRRTLSETACGSLTGSEDR